MPYPSPHEKRIDLLQKIALGVAAAFAGVLFALFFIYAMFHSATACGAEISGYSVFTAVNQERKSHDLKPLVPSPLLVHAAQEKAEDMVKYQYFAHRSPRGDSLVTFLTQVKYPYRSAGENLATQFTDDAALLKAWMDSPTHRKNILDSEFTETGIGIAKGKNGLLIVQMFGRRL